MKLQFVRKFNLAIYTLLGLGVLGTIGTVTARADQWDKKTILTVDQPIQVTDQVLAPGKYVLKLADSQADRHIVQIFNGDQSHIVSTVLAIPNYRLRPTGRSQFAFWETPPGAAKALRAWFYPGDNFGQEFAYPKNVAMLQVSQPSVAVLTQPEPAPQEAPVPQATSEPPVQEETHVEMAQNNPPAPPPAAEPQPVAPVQPAMPESLPKTGTPYPTIGLGGLILLGLYGLLRFQRVLS